MSDKKQLLTESEVSRFMRLANISAIGSKALMKETTIVPPGVEREGSPQEEATAMSAGAVQGGMEDEAVTLEEEELEVGGSDDMEKIFTDLLMKVKETAEEHGVQLDIETGASDDVEVELGDETAEEAPEMDGEEEAGEGEEDEKESEEEGMMKEEAEEEEEEEEETEEEGYGVHETTTLSEDDLVETVLNRVTARLVAEAKKGKKGKLAAKKAMKDKMKKAEEKKKMTKEAVDAKGGGPLLKKGGHKGGSGAGWEKAEDMAYAKGEKGGKGGHKLEKVTAKAEHTVTHGKTNLATKGSVK